MIFKEITDMSILSHAKYFHYVFRHKFFVFLECCRLGIPWQGIMHDVSKLSPSEWRPYVNVFFGKTKSPRDETGAYDPSSIGGDFDNAWLHHQHHNPHHWQYWVLLGDEGKEKILNMPIKYRKEMLADWRGAGRAHRTPNTVVWYMSNKEKMRLHPETRNWIERQLGLK